MSVVRALPRPRTFGDVCDFLQALEARTVTLSEGLAEVNVQIGRLAAEVSQKLHPYRPSESSYHDFDPDVAEFRNVLKRSDSVRARQIVRQGIRSAKMSDKAAKYDAILKAARYVVLGVVIGVLTAVIAWRVFGVKPS